MKITKNILFLISFLLLMSCKSEVNKEVKLTGYNTLNKHAQEFEIQLFNDYKKLIIKLPYKDSKQPLEYILLTKGTDLSQFSETDKTIQIPIKNIVVTSTTHIAMLELLGVEHTLVGFPNTKYVSSEKTRKLIDNGNIKELGMDANLNTEILIDLNPDVVIGFSVNGSNKSLTTAENAGIPVIYNGDWLEETPLGRAEWIKFFGVLFDKEQKADSIFKSIENQYNIAKKIAFEGKNKPTILSGAMFKDVWNLPAGESFVAQFLNDANTNYLWKSTKGKGSLQLNFENVLDKAQNADLWLAPGYFSTKEQMLSASEHYKQFKAFENGELYTFANKKGETGGVIYYELAPTRPDLVLKDIIKITHPELMEDYELVFFERME
ncbi:MAG: ABC transporter substrate-binding protein [Flavobacteriaceae bacterium]|nr:ABC transporter substrate-binding protein [Flavobacteriaceae bacterium]